MEKNLKNVEDIINEYTGLSRKVLEYSQVVKRLVGEAKQPGFTEEGWAPLREFIDAENFERVGNFKEEMNWDDYVGFLTGWAQSFEWDCSFRRIHEFGNLVFLELEERSQCGDFKTVVNSASVYQFNEDGKIRFLDVYLQMELPDEDMLKGLEGL